MASNWGDFNGDGKTDYVDYKIYTTQVDPYSGEYQGNSNQNSFKPRYPRQKSSLNFVHYIIIMALYIVAFFVLLKTPLVEFPGLASIILMGIVIISVVLIMKIQGKI